jgi:hypothetical protein
LATDYAKNNVLQVVLAEGVTMVHTKSAEKIGILMGSGLEKR